MAAVLGLNVTNADSMAKIADNRSITASKVSVTVEDNTDSRVVSDGSTASADSNLSVALALNIVDVDLEASIGRGATINASGDVVVDIDSLEVAVGTDSEGNKITDKTSTFDSSAIAGAGQGNFSLAGALGLNVVDFSATAQISSDAVVNTTGDGSLSVEATTYTAYKTLAEGVSGGLTTPTVEAAKDRFDPFARVQARIDGYSSDIGGAIETAQADALALKAAAEEAQAGGAESESDSADDGDEEEEKSSSIGIGAAFAITIAKEDITAQIAQNARATVGGDLSLSASAHSETSTESSAGAGPESGATDEDETEAVGYSLDAAVALNVFDQDAVARVQSHSQTLTVGGDASLVSTSETAHHTLAHGEAAGEKAAAGASVAVSVVKVDSTAYLGRSLTAGGKLSLEATSEGSDIADAKATARGLVLEKYANKFKKGMNLDSAGNELLGGNFNNSEGAAPKDSPHSVQALSDHGAKTQSSDQQGQGDSKQSDSISIAAAVGINVVDYNATATTADGLALSTGGSLEVKAKNHSNYHSRGLGLAVLSDKAIAVGVGVSNTSNTTTAQLGKNTRIPQAGKIALIATATQNQAEPFADKFAAEGVAGAGAKKLGVAGALALVNTANHTDAQVGAGTQITNAQSLRVESSELSRLRAKAWGASVAVNQSGDAKAAVGAAFAVINTLNKMHATIENNVQATITGDIVVLAQNQRQSEEDFNFSGSFDALNPTALLSTTNYYTEAVGAAGATGDRALAGSFGVSVSHNQIYATLGNNVRLTTGSLDMDAKNRSNARSLTGGVAAAQKLAVGGTVSAIILRDDVQVSSGTSTTVQASGAIALNALVEQDIGNLALAGAVATSENALAGAAGINVFDNKATVAVGTGGSLGAGANLTLAADNQSRVANFTGQGSYGGKTGAGGVIALNLFLNETTATTEGSSTLNAGGKISLRAQGREDILNAALGATAGADNGLAGTLGLNTVKSVVRAEGKGGSRFNHNNDAQGTAQSVAVLATSTTHIAELIGAGAAGGNNGIGASLDTNVIWKNVLAKIDGPVNGDGNIQVIADVEQTISSASVGFAGSNSTAIAGAGSIGVFKSTTEAAMGSQAVVTTKGSVQVHAEDETDIVQLTGSASLSSSTAVGGAVGVSTFVGRTTAKIADNATVTALGKGEALNVVTGEVVSSSRLLKDLAAGNVEGLRGAVESGLSAQTVSNLRKVLRGETKQMAQSRGVAVTAYSDQNIVNIAAAGSGGGSDTAAGNITTTVVVAKTEAVVGMRTSMPIAPTTPMPTGNKRLWSGRRQPAIRWIFPGLCPQEEAMPWGGLET